MNKQSNNKHFIFESAIYEIISEKNFTFKINQYSNDLKDLLNLKKTKTAAFITAYNPYGLALDDAANKDLQSALIKALRFRNLRFLEGKGYAHDESWEPEMSALILGINFEAAKSLGAKFNQLAIVWIDESFIPTLVMLEQKMAMAINKN